MEISRSDAIRRPKIEHIRKEICSKKHSYFIYPNILTVDNNTSRLMSPT